MTLQPCAGVKHPSRRRAILLVEDEPFVREATCGILQFAGFDMLSAANALDAMKIYEECDRRIDLVMTDMVLSGRTGEQLGQDLRARWPEVLVLITSGYFHLECEIEVPKSQTFFLAKPYSKRVLVAKIENILGMPLARAAGQAG